MRESWFTWICTAQAQLGYTSSLDEYNRLAAINFNWKDALLRDGEVVTNQISVTGGEEPVLSKCK